MVYYRLGLIFLHPENDALFLSFLRIGRRKFNFVHTLMAKLKRQKSYRKRTVNQLCLPVHNNAYSIAFTT